MPGRFPQETFFLNTDDLHSFFASSFRLGRGVWVLNTEGSNPDEPLELYEFELCPYCRKVREVLTELDLQYVCHPCGKGSNNRSIVEERGGKQQFPYLVDPNTGREMFESEDIIDYLCKTYGSGRTIPGRLAAPVNTIFAGLSSLVRRKGFKTWEGCRDRQQPGQLLELYNFEASPFCRKVREKLCELNLDYLVHNVGKGSPRREALKERGGKIQVPYLIDPNTRVSLFESYDINEYLESEYG